MQGRHLLVNAVLSGLITPLATFVYPGELTVKLAYYPIIFVLGFVTGCFNSFLGVNRLVILIGAIICGLVLPFALVVAGFWTGNFYEALSGNLTPSEEITIALIGATLAFVSGIIPGALLRLLRRFLI